MEEDTNRYGLTKTEYKFLFELVQGKTNFQIGEVMHISPHTVKIHVAKILEKFCVHNRIQATAKAIRENIVPDFDVFS